MNKTNVQNKENKISGNVIDDDHVTVVSNTQPAHGRVKVEENGEFVFTPPNASWCGIVEFSYEASNGYDSTVSIVVTPEGDPVRVGDRIKKEEYAKILCAFFVVFGVILFALPVIGNVILGLSINATYIFFISLLGAAFAALYVAESFFLDRREISKEKYHKLAALLDKDFELKRICELSDKVSEQEYRHVLNLSKWIEGETNLTKSKEIIFS